MAVDKIKFQDIVKNQLPEYVQDDYPLLGEFLSQYYLSQENDGATFDLLNNIDSYVKIDNLYNLKESTGLASSISYFNSTIQTSSETNFTEGFPEKNGIIKIDDEIIFYAEKTDLSFTGCKRGFSGITSYTAINNPEELVFTESLAQKHAAGATIQNLNILFLKEFFKKLKTQVAPGFSGRSLYTGLDERNFLYNVKDFYNSKGTDQSLKILFQALYGEEVLISKPSEDLFRPSDADYLITKDFVIEAIEGNPFDLEGKEIIQSRTSARGTVTKVEVITTDDRNFYQISVDSGYQRDINLDGSILGVFEDEPKTQILNDLSVNSTVIDVDSTIGFPSSGSLISYDENDDEIIITYTSKSANQFFGVSGIDVAIKNGANLHLNSLCTTLDEDVSFRITTTLKELQIDEITKNFTNGEAIQIQSLGIESNDKKTDDWIYNLKVNYKIKNITILDVTEKRYLITTNDNNILKRGYEVEIIENDQVLAKGTVNNRRAEDTVDIRFNVLLPSLTGEFFLENKTLKGNYRYDSEFGTATTNVINTYQKFNGEVLISSNSIPSYDNITLDTYNKVIKFSSSNVNGDTFTFNQQHGLYTGEIVYYKPNTILGDEQFIEGDDSVQTVTINKFSNINEGVYFVKRVGKNNSFSIKLAKSLSDLNEEKFITPLSDVSIIDNTFTYQVFYNKKISPQKIYRKLVDPVKKQDEYNTQPGFSGILKNGVEILNYKSNDQIFFGDIKSMEIVNGGENYDVVNPPILNISDVTGIGATGICGVIGQLEEIRIVDPGFDFVSNPTVSITGGNPVTEALVNVETVDTVNRVNFLGESGGGITTHVALGVGATDATIGFSTFHKFFTGEKVVYKTYGSKAAVGLSTDSNYFVKVVNPYKIKLHKSELDANSGPGINTISITDFGEGLQSIDSFNLKKKVSNFVILNKGSGYKNRRKQLIASGISTSTNIIKIIDHGFLNKEKVRYTIGINAVTGLSEDTDYFVHKIDNNNFKLSEIGVGDTSTFFYDNNIFVDLKTTGDGSFNYEPITVTVDGLIGITTLTGQKFDCRVQPIFRGELESIDITNGGVSYGSSEVFNFNRLPEISISAGSGGQVTPIINNGRIEEVLIDNNGSGYNSPPDLQIISSNGSFAKLTPVVFGGQLKEIVVVDGGAGYDDATTINVISPIIKANVEPIIKKWTVNLFAKNFDILTSDDGIITKNNENVTLQYSHLYAPRKLRESLNPISDSGVIFGTAELKRDAITGEEQSNTFHSPIIGWAFDGHPIYGPYGFKNPNGGPISAMVPGYELSINTINRPETSLYEAGFFVEDFVFTNNGDLDKHNGRFCVTPDYPNGIYAYFATIENVNSSSGPFEGFRSPKFPYLIGNSFNSEPISFNFKLSSNHDEYDIEKDGWFRNTKPYRLYSNPSGYDYIYNSSKIKNQSLDITNTSVGTVESIKIVNKGDNFKIGDKLVFDNTQTSGSGASAEISRIDGKKVVSISATSTSFDNTEFFPDSLGRILAFTQSPHNLPNKDLVSVSGASESFNDIQGTFNINVRPDNFVLSLGIGATSVTGLTTYFYVSGILDFPRIRPNDIIGIKTEKLKVLNIDKKSGRIRVSREHGGTIGTSYSNSEILTEDPRKLSFNVGFAKTTKQFKLNEEYYFEPSEAVGTGITDTIGAGKTVVFSVPGVGGTQVFIPSQSIYIPNHKLSLNDEIIYNNFTGVAISAWNGIAGIAYTPLTSYSNLYAVPLTNTTIGVSSNKVGLASVGGGYRGLGSLPGLLYFTSEGTGDYHSFKTNHSNVIKGEIGVHTITVSTASTHQMQVNDIVFMDLNPNDTATIEVKYNDFNRRMVFGPKNFLAADVDISENTINLTDHEYEIGDRVIYSPSATIISGLENEGMYYVFPFTKDKIKLALNKIDIENKKFVIINSAEDGTISRINPLVKASKNQKIVFDLSDKSLSFVSSGSTYSAFDMNIYTDSEFTNIFRSSKTTNTFEVSKSGEAGINADASLTINLTDEVPDNLWYKFSKKNLSISPDSKSGFSDDDSVKNYNQIDIQKSVYEGQKIVTGVGSTTFTYSVSKKPRILSEYDFNNSKTKYQTTSKTSNGPINRIKVNFGGKGYKSLPGISSVSTDSGKNQLLDVESSSIGIIQGNQFNSNNIGFGYPSDRTLRPIANLPEILRIQPLASFERIGISSSGNNYLIAPDLIVFDVVSNKVITSVDLEFNLGDPVVNILKNTTGLNDVNPRILPVNNTNGVGINSLSFDSSTNRVKLYLNTSFSNSEDFPFTVGKNVLVEKIDVGLNTTGKGYNSEDYSYSLFEVTSVDPKLGGSGAFVEYSLDEVLSIGETPGAVVSAIYGRVVPEHQFPVFDITLSKNNYIVGEKVSINDDSANFGFVESWDPLSEMLKVSISKEIQKNDSVRGLSSNTQGTVRSKDDFNSEIIIGAGATIINGWQRSAGFFNETTQRIPDNQYYQKFSYSIRSKIPFKQWDSTVSALNHAAGFAKYADLQVVSELSNSFAAVVKADESNIETIVDIISTSDINCNYNFDYVRDRTVFIKGEIHSTEIVFQNKIINDYFESVGNRVLSIDDISEEFNSNERADRFSSVGGFENTFKLNKMFTFAKDVRFTDEKQFSILNLIQDSETGYINEYSILESVGRNLGSYDYLVTSDGWDLTFNPALFEFNNYNTSVISFSALSDYSGIGSVHAVGTAVSTFTEQHSVPTGTATTIATIPTTFRSAKVLVMLEDSSDNYIGNELNIIHDGSDVSILEYGNIADSSSSNFVGFGTFDANIVGGNIIVNYTSNASSTLTANTQVVSISDSATGIGTILLDVGRLRSSYVSIPVSGAGLANTITSFDLPYQSGYYFVTVKDTTNNVYEAFEIAAIDSGSETEELFVEFANVSTGSSIGQIGISTAGISKLDIVYTPNSSTAVEVRTFGIELQIFDENENSNEVDYLNWKLKSSKGSYTGTKTEIRTDFDLNHAGIPIFKRIIDGSNPSIADTTSNIVRIPNHFFVTGENINYSNSGAGTTQSIGITSTSISGIVTDKLPDSLFVVKVDEGSIRFADTAENALKVIPETLTLDSVGIGDSHVFTSKNQNTKALVAIDNMIQSPIVATGITAALGQDIIFATSFSVTGVNSIFSSDVIQVNDEIMVINDAGSGSDATFNVLRGKLGTSIQSHGVGSTITKLGGNYNIVENRIHFAGAPFGKNPIGSITNPPDSRDFTGITTSSSFQGRTFLRNAAQRSTSETYADNYIFDDISRDFTGVTSSFILKSGGDNVTGISTGNGIILVNGIFQLPKGIQPEDNNYNITESAGVSTITFQGSVNPHGYDPGAGDFPMGGTIISVGSSSGSGYQPLVSAGGTANVSIAGTVSSISIGNSGSGYRSGIQTTVNVAVTTSSTGIPNLEFIGTAIVSNGNVINVNITNPGSGYTFTNPPLVVFDEPFSYTDIPLEYTSSSIVGSGRSATVDLTVGRGTGVIDFTINNRGYGYGVGEVLTVDIGGVTGIPTDITKSFEEFSLTIEKTQTDSFNGWSVGQFAVLDSFESEFDGFKKTFRLTENGQTVSIIAQRGSTINIEETLVILINNVLQKPNEAFTFEGGSIVEFKEAPVSGQTAQILFYKGSGDDIDVIFRDIVDSVKVGDSLDIDHNPRSGQSIILDQDKRIVTGINTIDTVETNLYNGVGINSDGTITRPVTWCKQTSDLVVNGSKVSKNRGEYEPVVKPSAYLIKNVSTSSTEMYVNNLIPSFNPVNEISNATVRNAHQKIVQIYEQGNFVGAAATAVVSVAGTVSSFDVTNSGLGYTSAPKVFVSNISGSASTEGRAEGTAVIGAGGSITSILVSYGGTTTGTAYTTTNPPSVLIEPPASISEKLNILDFSGDYGMIVGINSTKVGTQHRLTFDTFIPKDSLMRDTNLVSTATTISGISTSDYFTVFGTNISIGGTFAAKSTDGTTTVGIASTALDCVYQVQSFEDVNVTCFVGGNTGFTTTVRRVSVNVDRIAVGFASTSTSELGEYSWGKLTLDDRTRPRDFTAHTMSGIGSAYSNTGISTSAVVRRFNALKSQSYS
ncbi:YHYH protein [Schleiferiaceae bacterium]|nr:YHYH protein [Schleiferiaceae bacterium]